MLTNRTAWRTPGLRAVRLALPLGATLGLALGATGPLRAAPSQGAPPNMTAKELEAHTLWSLRAGLNVSALQCQFSKSLRTVGNYNAFIRHHSDELASAVKTLTNYFSRTLGAKAGTRGFDSYTTRTYQGFATFDAQYSFCDQAAATARRGLSVPKGKAGAFAMAEMDGLKASLVPPAATSLAQTNMSWVAVPDVSTCKKRGSSLVC
jgi:hypothetical protein